MIMHQVRNLAFYWSAPTGAIINVDLPGAQEAAAQLEAGYPSANQACIDIIDVLVSKNVELEKRLLELEHQDEDHEC